MEIKIKATKRVDEICIKAMQAAIELYKGDIGPVIEILKEGFVEPANFNLTATKNFNKYLKDQKLADPSPIEKVLKKIGGTLNGVKDLEFADMDIICNALELIERIWIGQWNHLTHVIEDKWFFNTSELREINILRDKITDAYSRKGIGDNASYGIYSLELKDEVRLLYAFQKIYRYEKSARGCDMGGFTLDGELGKEVPEIILPYKETITFNSYDEIADYADKFAKAQEKDFPFNIDRRKIYFEDGKYYFQTSDSISYLTEPGDTIHLRQNDFFVVEKSPENIAKYEASK